MPFDVTMPDGALIRDVPDGTTKAQLAAKYQAHTGGSLMRDAGRRVADNAAAFVEGAAALPDLAAGALGRVLGLGARAFGADGVASQLENPVTIGGTVRRLAPEVQGNDLARGIINAVGGFAGGVGAGNVIARGGGRVAQGIGQELAANPKAQIVGGAAANLAASGAKAAGAPIPLQVLAGLAGGTVAPGSFDAAAGAAATATRPLRQSYAQEQAARILKNNVERSPEAVAARIRQAISAPSASGALPTTAEVAGDRALAGFQRGVQSLTPQGGAALTGRYSDNANARFRAAEAAFGTGNADALPNYADQALARQQGAVTRAIGNVGPLVPADVSGAELRALLEERAAATKAAAQARYNIPGGEEPIQIGAVEPNSVDNLPAGPSADTLARESFIASGKAAMKPAPVDNSGTLATWIVKQGGIKPKRWNGELGLFDDAPGVADLRAAGVNEKSRPGLFSAKGKTLEQLYRAARDDGFFHDVGEGARGQTFDQLVQALADDVRGSGKGGSGARVRRMDDMAALNNHENAANANWWGREFQARNLDPEKMSADDWDAMYRDVSGVEAPAVSMHDMAQNGGGGTLLSPFQASMQELKRQYFPAGLPPASGVGKLIDDLTKADVLQAREAERIVRDLRRQAGMLKGSDGVSAGLAKAAANAAEGFVSAQSGPARADALRGARSFYRDEYKGVYANNEPGRALATDQFGRNRLDAAQVPAAVVPAGRTGANAAARLAKAAGPEAAEKAAREELRRALDSAGTDPARISRMADGYADTLRAYPTLAGDVTRARDMAALVDAFKASPLGRLKSASDPVAEVAKMVRSQDRGADLRKLIAQTRDNSEAASGLRRALAENIERSAASKVATDANGKTEIVNNALRQGIKNVLDRTAMTDLLSRDQRRVLLNINMETKRAQFAATANRTPGSDTARNAALWGQFASVVLHGNPKIAGAKSVLDLAVAVMGRADAVRELTVQAMLDPKLAADLLMSPTPDRIKSLGERMAAYTRGAVINSADSATYSADRM